MEDLILPIKLQKPHLQRIVLHKMRRIHITQPDPLDLIYKLINIDWCMRDSIFDKCLQPKIVKLFTKVLRILIGFILPDVNVICQG